MSELRRSLSLLVACAAWAGSPVAGAQVPGPAARAVGPIDAGPSSAVSTPVTPAPGTPAAAAVAPFRVGERLEYDLYFRRHRAGRGVLEVEGREVVGGVTAYRVSLRVDGGPFFFRIDDRKVSWIALEPFRSLRFEEHLREGGRESWRTVELDHASGTYRVRRPPADAPGATRSGRLPEGAVDELAFFYLLRTLRLEEGSRQELHRFYESEENPVTVSVEGRRQVKTPGGTFRTLVVRPVVPGVIALAEEAEAEVLLSDDDRRFVVQITSRTPVGEVTLRLRDVGEGSAAADGASGAAAGEPERRSDP